MIVGHGVTGRNLEKEILILSPDIADIKYEGVFKKHEYDAYDIIFICVDTPYVSEEAPCNISAVEDVIREYSALLSEEGVFVIKSTVLPGTTDGLSSLFKVPIVHSPEYYGSTQHCNNFDFGFTILGGDRRSCMKVQQALQECHDARHSFRITDSMTAELTKYMENCWLAARVAFCCQFFDIAERCGVAYEDLRELFILDPRVSSPSHTFVYRAHPFYESHCLGKDVPAMAAFADASLLKSIIKFNEEQKTKYGKK